MTTAFEISERVVRQALVRPYRRGRHAPLVRPLRIYTIDPSVSDRLGGVATVEVPYEKLEPGPAGSLFQVSSDGAPAPLEATPLDLDDPELLLSSGLTPTPSNGGFHLQMVYAVCSLTYSAFRRALGRDIAWATTPPANGPLRLIVRPFGFRGPNAGYSRETGDLSFGYFNAGRDPAGFTIPKGLICTSLSHDIIVHETTHALLDGLRSSFLLPTNVDVPAFHEGFADLVALFLHFTYADVVERAIGESRGAITRGSLLADLAREFGHARSPSGRNTALRSGIDVDGIAAFDSDVPLSAKHRPVSMSRQDPSRTPLGRCLPPPSSKRSRQSSGAKRRGSSTSPASIPNRSGVPPSARRSPGPLPRKPAMWPVSSSTSPSEPSTTARQLTWSSVNTSGL
jgi:hypothetical protein